MNPHLNFIMYCFICGTDNPTHQCKDAKFHIFCMIEYVKETGNINCPDCNEPWSIFCANCKKTRTHVCLKCHKCKRCSHIEAFDIRCSILVPIKKDEHPCIKHYSEIDDKVILGVCLEMEHEYKTHTSNTNYHIRNTHKGATEDPVTLSHWIYKTSAGYLGCVPSPGNPPSSAEASDHISQLNKSFESK